MQTVEFKEKVLPLSRKMMRFADRFLKNSDEAQDVVQEVFLKLWQKKDALHTIENIEAFAMRMTYNQCIDTVRKKRMYAMNEKTEKTLESNGNSETDRLEWSDTAGQIKKLIMQLPEQQQTTILLRDVENYEYNEIAEITGLTENALRVNLSRARKKVKDELLKIWKNESDRSKAVIGKIF